MGIKLFSSDCSSSITPSMDTSPNPNPFRFSIKDFFDYKNCCILIVKYDDCTTFDGLKVLVLRGHSSQYKNLKKLDPHFFVDSNIIARFPPTNEGIEHAKIFSKSV